MKTLALLLLLIPAAARARGLIATAADKGTTSGQFLKLGAGAKAAAMGNAYTAAATDASALYWNPAAMTRVRAGSLVVMHGSYLDSSAYDYAAFAQNVGAWGTLGLGVQTFTSGKINATDVNGNDNGTFSTGDMAVTIGHAYEIKDSGDKKLLSVGVAAKLVRSKLVTTAQTWAWDLGVLSAPLFDDKLRLGASASNLGGRLTYDQTPAPLPVLIKGGGAYTLNESWLATLDAGFPNDNNPYAALGTAYLITVSEDVRLTGRIGINSQSLSESGNFAGLSAGLGFMMKRLSIDYAFAPVAAMGMTHRISLSWAFGSAD